MVYVTGNPGDMSGRDSHGGFRGDYFLEMISQIESAGFTRQIDENNDRFNTQIAYINGSHDLQLILSRLNGCCHMTINAASGKKPLDEAIQNTFNIRPFYYDYRQTSHAMKFRINPSEYVEGRLESALLRLYDELMPHMVGQKVDPIIIR